MPGYKGHIAGGIVIYGVTLAVIMQNLNPSPVTMIEWFCFTVAGALFPDIDIKSKGQKLFYWLLLGIIGYLIFHGYAECIPFIAILAIVPLLSRHRGLFHKLWFVILLPSAVAFLMMAYWAPSCSSLIFFDCLFFIMGAISHLVLDLGIRRTLKI